MGPFERHALDRGIGRVELRGTLGGQSAGAIQCDPGVPASSSVWWLPTSSTLVGREALERTVAGRVPPRRFGTVEEVAEAILFLVSGRASYITGHALVIDGGERLVGAGPES